MPDEESGEDAVEDEEGEGDLEECLWSARRSFLIGGG